MTLLVVVVYCNPIGVKRSKRSYQIWQSQSKFGRLCRNSMRHQGPTGCRQLLPLAFPFNPVFCTHYMSSGSCNTVTSSLSISLRLPISASHSVSDVPPKSVLTKIDSRYHLYNNLHHSFLTDHSSLILQVHTEIIFRRMKPILNAP